jgi:hypothetical protein
MQSLPLARCVIAALVLSAVSANAQQTPTFASGKGPIVAIDEAHKNTHAFGTASFRGLVGLLQGDGYRVRPLAESITPSSLTGVDVLVISGPGGWLTPDESLSSAEVAEVLQWIKNGGCLLLILDHMPAPQNAGRLTAALGVSRWHDGYAMVNVQDSAPLGNIIFWRSDSFPAGAPAVGPTGPAGGQGYQGVDAVLARHPITEGRMPEQRVRRVATFGGSAFLPPPGAEVLLTMPRDAVSLTPLQTPGAVPSFPASTPRTPVGGWLQGAVLKLGRGRVALFGETGLFSGGPAADNRTFVLNVMHWLSGML